MTVAQSPSAGSPRFGPDFEAKLTQLFRWRRDVRHFATRPLPAGTVDRLLDLADLAPSVGLSQPWRFVQVDDPGRRAAVRANFEACNRRALDHVADTRQARYARLKLAGLDDAPCHIAVFVEPDPVQGHGLGRQTMPETVGFSAVMAIHTLWLAARAAGVGLGWVSILDPVPMNDVLAVPAEWAFVAYLCLGYPAQLSDIPTLESDRWETRRSSPRLLR